VQNIKEQLKISKDDNDAIPDVLVPALEAWEDADADAEIDGALGAIVVEPKESDVGKEVVFVVILVAFAAVADEGKVTVGEGNRVGNKGIGTEKIEVSVGKVFGIVEIDLDDSEIEVGAVVVDMDVVKEASFDIVAGTNIGGTGIEMIVADVV
jgi:hypothetical protein